jgi:ATP-dependent Clp protease ATP-binding subunit ClpA
MVNEPTVEDTISILRGLKEKYEVHHGVRITDAALVSAAVYSNRYITDRKLPDKAIDLVDEACSALRLQQESKPDSITEVLHLPSANPARTPNNDNPNRTGKSQKRKRQNQYRSQRKTRTYTI